MNKILRLSGLDSKAGPEDIRTFFGSLSIPDGGVYIVGGSLQEAFIAFNTEKEAELAMQHTGLFLRGSSVRLHMSSMEELEHKLEAILKKRKKGSPSVKRPQPAATLASSKTQSPEQNVANFSPSPAWSVDPDAANVPHLNAQDLCSAATSVSSASTQPIDSHTAFLLGVYTTLQTLQSSQPGESCDLLQNVDFLNANSTTSDPDELCIQEPTVNETPGYIRLFGLPATTTKDDICHFFKGLAVKEAIVNVKLGCKIGCLVKFASKQDARDALNFNQQLFGTICVDIRTASEKMWDCVLQECENGTDAAVWESSVENSVKEREHRKRKHTSGLQVKQKSFQPSGSLSPKRTKLDSDAKMNLPVMEQVVMVKNLPKAMNKTEIKELFGCMNMPHKNILHLFDKEGNKTNICFLLFYRTEDYDYAMNLSGCHVGSDSIEVSSITREKMRQMIAENHCPTFRRRVCDPRRQPRGKTLPETQTKMLDPAAQTCLFVRNLPAEVQKGQIESLFSKYHVKKENITILHDIDGNGIGEAVVQFKSTETAQLAKEIHGESFLGTQLFLTLITVRQMEDILENHSKRH